MRGTSLMRYKIAVTGTKVLDETKATVRAVVSTEAVDRDNDVIRAAGWQLDAFKLHPVLISSHNYGTLRSVIGTWDSMEIKQRPPRLEGVARYYVGEGNDEADWAFNLAKKGQAAYSVGFLPDMEKAIEREDGGLFGSWEFNGQELLEVSHVAIPSNREALQQLKALMENTKHGDPALLSLVTATLKEVGLPPEIDWARILDIAVRKAHMEVFQW